MTDRDPGFVKLHRTQFPAYCRNKQIQLEDRGVFEHLILEADWRTGIVKRFTLTKCSRELGLGELSGRRTLGPFLRRLHDLGVITYTPSAGGLPGAVVINDYHYVANIEPRASVPSQGPSGARRSKVRRAALPQNDARPRSRADRPKNPAPPATSRTEEVPLGVEENLASERGGSSDTRAWQDHELETLLAPLLEFCRRANKPGITGRAGAVAALAPYSRAQIARALEVFMPEVRNARADRFEKPVGLFLSKARKGAAEYFTVPPAEPSTAAAVVTQPVPRSSFGRPLIDKSDLSERYGD